MALLLIVLVLAVIGLPVCYFYYAPPSENYIQASNAEDFSKAWEMTGYNCSSFDYQIGSYKDNYELFPPGNYNANTLHKLISSADNKAESILAVRYWLNVIKQNPYLLAGDAKIILNKDVDAAQLSNNNYSTDTAISLVNEVWMKLSNAKLSIWRLGPINSYEIALFDDTMRISSDSSWRFFSDLKSIKITLDDGRTIWILGEGGDIVVKDNIYGLPTYNPEDG